MTAYEKLCCLMSQFASGALGALRSVRLSLEFLQDQPYLDSFRTEKPKPGSEMSAHLFKSIVTVAIRKSYKTNDIVHISYLWPQTSYLAVSQEVFDEVGLSR